MFNVVSLYHLKGKKKQNQETFEENKTETFSVKNGEGSQAGKIFL